MSNDYGLALSRRSLLQGAGAAGAALLVSGPAQAETVLFREADTNSAVVRALLGSVSKDILPLHFKTLDMPDSELAEILSSEPRSRTITSLIREMRATGSTVDEVISRGLDRFAGDTLAPVWESLRSLKQGFSSIIDWSDQGWLDNRNYPPDGVSSPVLRALSILSRPIGQKSDNTPATYCSDCSSLGEGETAHHKEAFVNFLEETGLVVPGHSLPKPGSPRLGDAAPQDPILIEIFEQYLGSMMYLRALATQSLCKGVGSSANLVDGIEQAAHNLAGLQAEAADYIQECYPGSTNDRAPHFMDVGFRRSSILTLPTASARRAVPLRP